MRTTVLVLASVILCCSLTFGVQEKILYNFGTGDGYYPYGTLIFDASGNLYGTTYAGGKYYDGTVFKLTKNQDGTWTESVLYNFAGGEFDGMYPTAGLTFDSQGNLYGTTNAGGHGSQGTCWPRGCGIVFQLIPQGNGTWQENVLMGFGLDPQYGINPWSGVVLDQAGNVYGTSFGGTSGYGVIFELTPNLNGTWDSSVLYNFTGGDDGGFVNGLAIDGANDLYTFASNGGQNHAGTVFKLAPEPGGKWTGSVLYTFKGGEAGISPAGTPLFDSSGNLYGATQSVQTSATIFKLTPKPAGPWGHTVVHRFRFSPDGYNPDGILSFDPFGSLYGTTTYGGKSGIGTVFRLSPVDGGVRYSRFSFDVSNGEYPLSGVVFDQTGNLYGTTDEGGNPPYGVVYEITP